MILTIHFENTGVAYLNKDILFFLFSKAHDEEKLSQFLEDLMSDGTVLDGTVSESPSRQSSQIWELRERIAEALKKDGYTYKYDISLPLDNFYDR